MLNRKTFFWILFVPIFADLFLGGIIFALTSDYWFGYMAFPINMIEGVGFTFGFTLIPLAIYCFFVYKLFLTSKSLGKKYISYLFKGSLLLLFLYAIGFAGQFIRLTKSNFYRDKRDEIRKENLVEFKKDVSVKDLSIQKIQDTSDSYKANFVINIPSKYVIFDEKNHLGIKVDSMDTVSKIDTYVYYMDKRILDTKDDFNSWNPNEIKLVFNENGSLDINIEYVFMRPNNKEDLTKDKINVSLKFKMLNMTNLCPINICPVGNKWEYNTQIPISY